MKKLLLFPLFILSCSVASAQTFTSGATYWDQDYENSSLCIYNAGVPAHLWYGQNINNDFQIENHVLTFTTPSSSLAPEGCPSWVGFTHETPTVCDFVKNEGGVDLSDHPYLSITAKSDVEGAKMTVYLGSVASGNVYFPTSSTRNTGTGMIKIDLILTTTFETYTINFTNETADYEIWSVWTDRTMVNAYGVTGQEPNAKYFISRVQIGAAGPVFAKTGSVTSTSSRVSSTDPCESVTVIQSSSDNSLTIVTDANGYIQIDPAFVTDKAVITDMFGRTEEFTGNDFYTQLRGVLVVNCVSGNRVKKAKVIM